MDMKEIPKIRSARGITMEGSLVNGPDPSEYISMTNPPKTMME